MADLSALSNDDLIRLHSQMGGGAAAAPPPGPDLSKLSNEDLLGLHQQMSGKQAPPVTVGPGLERSVGVSAPEPTAQQFAADNAAIDARKAQQPMSLGRDIVRSIGTGLVKGGAGIANTLASPVDSALYGMGWLATHGLEAAGVMPKGSADNAMANPPSTNPISGGDGLAPAVMAAAGGEHKPRTYAGQAAETVSSFLPGGALAANPKGVLDAIKTVPAAVLKYGVLPGAASETAGRYTEGTWLEPLARIAAGFAGGMPGLALDWRNARPKATVSGSLKKMTDAETAQAGELIQGGATLPEAVARATGGRVDLTDMQRVLEKSDGGQPVFSEFMSRRPDQNWAMTRLAFDQVAPRGAAPAAVERGVQTAAQGAVAATPEGQALTQAVQQVGPRVTPEAAGNVIRPDLQARADQLTQARSAAVDPMYAAARASQMPINTDPLLQHIGSRLAVTKGDINAGIEAARRNLFVGTAPDTSVAGLMESRKALGDQVSAATRAGNNQLASELLEIRGRLDTALAQAPEVAAANAEFALRSQPLAPFGDGRVPGQAIERDQFNSRYMMPAENVAPKLEQGGATAARDFGQVAGQPARQAFQGYLRTKLLDAATDPSTGAVTSQSIRGALRNNEDILAQHPEVRQRLEAVAAAREGMAPVEASRIGQLAAAEDFPKQASILFPAGKKLYAGQEMEIASAVSQVAKRNPDAARQLVRLKLEQAFDAASSNNPILDQRTGGNFSKALLENPQQARNLEAAVRALPDGDRVWSGMRKMFDIFEAQRLRQGAGSQTTNNTRIQESLKAGGLLQDVTTAASPGKLATYASDLYDQFKYGKNTKLWSQLFTNPDATAEMQQLRLYPSNSPKAYERAAGLVARAFSQEGEDRQRALPAPAH